MTLRTDDWRGLMSELDAIDRRLSELSDSTPDMAETPSIGSRSARRSASGSEAPAMPDRSGELTREWLPSNGQVWRISR